MTFFSSTLLRWVVLVISETYHLRKKLKKARERERERERVEIVAACC
jgi:hypothetical protein